MKMTSLLLLLLSTSVFSFPKTPDIELSPGEYCTTSNPDFKEYRYAERIPYCERNVSFELRESVCQRDGVTDRTDFKVDHIVPLNLGGSNSSRNLWCQHLTIDTEQLEFKVYELVKNNKLSRNTAVQRILNCKFNRVCN